MGEELERASLSELDRRFRAERDSMEAALALKRQEMALEKEVEMEQQISDFVKEREKEMLTKLEGQLSKKSYLTKKEVGEVLKTIESEIKVKTEASLLDARQSVLERFSLD